MPQLDDGTAVLGEEEAFLEEEYLQRSAFVDFSQSLSCLLIPPDASPCTSV